MKPARRTHPPHALHGRPAPPARAHLRARGDLGGGARRGLAHRRRRHRQRDPRRGRRPARARRRRLRRDRRRRVDPRDGDVAPARRGRAADRPRPPPPPVRASDRALVAVLLRAEGRVDHRAPDERRRRALRRPQPGTHDRRRQHPDARRRDRGALPARLAPRARGALRAAARDPRHALVPAPLACGVLGRPHADLGRHRPARGVGLGHGGRAGVQPGADVPEGVRGPERGEPGLEHPRPEALVGLLPGDRAARRARPGGGHLSPGRG